MKTTVSRLLCLLLAAITMTAAAQTNIKTAFNAIIKCQEAQITESHSLDKDPDTHAKTGLSDIYNFTLPADKINLVKNVISAFDKDSENSFSIVSGKTMNTDPEMHLAVGNGDGNGVRINDPDCNYVYALFLPSSAEDSEGIYRYAYGISYKEAYGYITGKLIVTYATTQKYRQQVTRERQFEVLRNLSTNPISISSGNSSQQSWFEMMVSYLQNISSASSQTRIALATKAYKLIQDRGLYPEMTASDKNTVREILKGMISDNKYSETILNKILNQCLVSLK